MTGFVSARARSGVKSQIHRARLISSKAAVRAVRGWMSGYVPRPPVAPSSTGAAVRHEFSIQRLLLPEQPQVLSRCRIP
jgi:hypothetical protein